MMPRSNVCAGLVLMLAATVPASSQAMPLVRVNGSLTLLFDQTLATLENYDQTAYGGLQGGFVHANPPGNKGYGVVAQSLSAYDAYGLHSVANNTAQQASPDGNNNIFIAESSSQVTATFNDFRIATPIGATGSISTRLNLHLGGLLGAGADAFSTFSTIAAVSVQLSNSNGVLFLQNFGAQYFKMGNKTDGFTVISHVDDVLKPFGIGYANAVDVKLNAFDLPISTDPLTLQIILSTAARTSVDSSVGGGAQAVVDLGNTLSFATDVPVFDLPAGYSISSADAGIVNNVFMPVPEPSTGAFFGAGLAGLLLRRALRRGKQ